MKQITLNGVFEVQQHRVRHPSRKCVLERFKTIVPCLEADTNQITSFYTVFSGSSNTAQNDTERRLECRLTP